MKIVYAASWPVFLPGRSTSLPLMKVAPAAVLIPLRGMRRDIGVHLGLQRLGQHPSRASRTISSISDGEPPSSWPDPSPGTTVRIGLYLPGRRANTVIA